MGGAFQIYLRNYSQHIAVLEKIMSIANPTTITLGRKTRTIRQWADELHISTDIIRARLKAGLPPEEILSRKARWGRRSKIFITHNGKTQSISEWSKELGLCDKTIRDRLRLGLSPKKSSKAAIS